MRTAFDEATLFDLANAHHHSYSHADPFPHVVMDDFIKPKILEDVLQSFPSKKDLAFYQYDNQLEKKLAFDQISKLPDPIYHLMMQLNSPLFLAFLEKLTGIHGLIPDPYYRGGGIHQIEKGGKLDVHIDFNIHPKLKLNRRLNLLIYLNKDWQASYGGHLELWRGHKNKQDKHVLETCGKRILPIFNRMMVFNTSESSYHGHPDPLTCPPDRTRKSIALYYYTSQCNSPSEQQKAHSTTFVKRPDDPPSVTLDQLRAKRNKQRLSTNIESNITA